MKTTRYSLLLLLMLATCSVTAQNTVYVYRNDGLFNAFFMEDVDSIVYSQIDIDSIMHENYVVQEIHTSDSIYRIPLNAIDSIGFIQPETIYEEDVVHLEGEVLDNIIEVNDLELVFSPTTPAHLLPQVGDKLAALEQTPVFPMGFTGKVAKITTKEKGLVYECDPLYLDDVVSKFFGIISLSNAEGPNEMMRLKRDTLNFIKLPLPAEVPVELSKGGKSTIYENIVRNSEVGVDLNYGFKVEGTLKPIVKVALSTGIWKYFGLEVVNVHYDSYIGGDLNYGVFGSLDGEVDVSPLKKTFFPFGIPVYVAVGVKGEIHLELAAQWNHIERAHHIGTISYSMNKINSYIANAKNLLTNKKEIIEKDVKFNFIVGSLDAKIGGYLDFGLGFEEAWVGFEISIGAKAETLLPNNFSDALFVADFLKPMNNSDFYDKYNEDLKFVIKPYIGVAGVLKIGKGDDNTNTQNMNLWQKIVNFFKHGWDGRIGWEPDLFSIEFFEGYLWPQFKTSENTHKGNQWTIEMEPIKKSFGKYKLGYYLYDEEDNYIDKTYHNQEYYTSYLPNSWGKPSFKSYSGTFTNLAAGKSYKAYPTFDFFGKDILASPVVLMDMCPDDKHPHAFDLGLPSGKLWACCDVGAKAPGEKGNYYAWGETSAKSSYDEESYRYYDKETFEYVKIGDNIENTKYDVAKSEWKGDWRMPNYDDLEELIKWTTTTKMKVNGVKGILFTGANGQSVFFPFAGDMHDNQLTGEGEYGYFWSASQARGYDSGAYNIFITDKPSATINYGRRHLGRTVRPVRDFKKSDGKE